MSFTFTAQFGPELGVGPGFVDASVDTGVIKTLSKPFTGQVYYEQSRRFVGEKFILKVREFKHHYMLYYERVTTKRLEQAKNENPAFQGILTPATATGGQG